MSDAYAAAPAAHSVPGSLPRRIVDTFFSPVALFRRFDERAPWADVMLVSVVLTVGMMAFIPTEVWVETAREVLRANPQPGVSAEAAAGMQRGFGIGASVIAPWIMLFIQAGLLVLVFNVVLGGNARFRQYLAIGAHAALITAVGTLATLPVILQQKNLQAQITLAALVPNMDADAFLYQFLKVFNVFTVWSLVVVALGVAAVNRKIGAGTAVGVVLGLFTAIAAGVAAIF